MNYAKIIALIKPILDMVLPAIKNLITSKVVPKIKRIAYEKVNDKLDKVINDLAQNVSKALLEADSTKKQAYIEGSTLGIETLELLANKAQSAAKLLREELERVK